jgi:predicted nucleic acid-binding protein
VPSDEPIVYADSSALVKLIIDEPESDALRRYLDDGPVLATSRIAVVEVLRGTALANPAPEAQDDALRMLTACLLIDLSHELARAAARLTSRAVRSLDAIHLASALRVEADQLVAYDRRLLAAAAARGLSVAHPGVTS